MGKIKYHLAYETQKHVNMVDEKELSKEVGKEVTKLEDLSDVPLMLLAINANAFGGLHRAGFALAHHQVSKEHFRYFVVADMWKEMFKGHIVIVNPEILEHPEETYEMRQGCLSHPYKSTRKVKTYEKLKVRFKDTELKEVEMDLEGLPAVVFLHEWFHTQGKTVYTAEFAPPENSKIMKKAETTS